VAIVQALLNDPPILAFNERTGCGLSLNWSIPSRSAIPLRFPLPLLISFGSPARSFSWGSLLLFSHDVQKRWRDSFAFGLVHRFGFASALQEFGIPKSALTGPRTVQCRGGYRSDCDRAAVIPMLMAFDRLAGSPVRGSHAAGRTPVSLRPFRRDRYAWKIRVSR
jgi:hypothetical protein